MRDAIEAYATLDNCRYCLMCRQADPLSHVTFDESLTPHGIALTIASQRRGLLDWNEDTLSILYSEVDAGIARAHCVTDQPFSESVASVRAEVAAAGLAPAYVYELRDRLARHGTLWGEAAGGAPRGEGAGAAADAAGVAGVAGIAGGPGTAALFLGDEAPYLWPAAVDAARRLLEVLGIGCVELGQGRNSGFMAASLGFPDLAREQAGALLTQLEHSGAERVIVLGPGDAYSLSLLYPERLGVPWPAGVEVVELTVVLAEAASKGALKLERASLGGPYAYVDPTHSVRRPARVDAPRALLDRLLSGERRELFWRRERAHPVGNTALRFTHPELADRLTRARLEDARSRGVKHLVCDDPSTLHQLASFAADYELEVHGLYDLATRHLGTEQAPLA